jgi:hypothetical protein
LKEDELRMAQLALLGIFDASFVRIFTNEDQKERKQYLKGALDKVDYAKTVFP